MGFRLSPLVFVALLCTLDAAHAVSLRGFRLPWQKTCETQLTGLKFEDDQAAFEVVVKHLGTVYEGFENQASYQNIKFHTLPTLRWRSPLIVIDVYGGANEGKSTLLNALPAMLYNHDKSAAERDETYRLERPISKTGDQPGLTKRPVVAIRPGQRDNKIVHDLYERMPKLQLHNGPYDAVNGRDGSPLLFEMHELPDNVAVIDTPDITSGDPRDRHPANLETAERALVTADVMMVLMEKRTSLNQHILRSIRDTFARYGRKQMILVYQADRHTPEPAALEHLHRFARAVYDLPADHVGAVEGVIGTYLMPYDPRVEAGLAHVELKPLASTPAFPDLLKFIGANPQPFKEAALRVATEKVREDVAIKVRDEYKSRLAAQIYYEAIEALTHTVNQDHARPFPYDQARRKWRNAFENLRRAPWPYLNKAAELFGKPEVFLGALMRLYPKFAQRERVIDELTIYNRNSVAEVQSQLNRRTLTLIENPPGPDRRRAGEQLVARLESFHKLFPEERRGDDTCVAPEGRVCVHLPRRELLPPAVRQKLEQFIQNSPDHMLSQIAEQEKATLKPDAEEINEAMRAVRKSGLASRLLRNPFWDVVTIGTFWATTLQVNAAFGGTFQSLLVGAGIGVMLAHIPREISEMRRDDALRPQLDLWYRRLQTGALERIFDKYLLGDLKADLKSPDDARTRAIDEMQQALRYLDPTLPELPAELTDKVVREE